MRNARVIVPLVAWTVCGLAACWAGAATYYVDFDGGSDAADGRTPAAAFRHYPGDPGAEGAAAAVTLAPGDTVIFKGSVHYRGHLVVKWAGRQGQPITYDGNTAGAFGKGPAILDGGEPITGWRRAAAAAECGGNADFAKIWTARVPTGVKGLAAFTAGLVQDDQMLYPAQYPNPEDPFYGDKLDTFLQLKSGMTETSITDARLEEMGGPALVGGYACVFVTGNDMKFVPIASYDAAAKRIAFSGKTQTPAGYYAVANSLSPKVFDRPGEYVFVDKPDAEGRHAVYIRPWDDADPSKGSVTYIARPLGVDMGQGRHYVTVQGFRIQNYQEAIHVREADGVVIRDNEITRIRQTGFANAVNASRVNDFLFADNHAHHMPKMRTVVAHTGERVVYQGNTVVRGGRSPLVFYNISFGRIIANHITDCRGMHSNGISIYVNCHDILVARNEVHNSNIAMTLQNAENIYVVDNVFTSPGGAAVGLWGGTPHKGHVFANNLIYSSRRSIYLNTDAVSGCTFTNNILSGFDGIRLGDDNTLSHNLYTMSRKGLREGELVVEDPTRVFADAAKGDFHLRPTGPAVDMGADVSALLPGDKFPGFDFGADFDGRPRKFGPRVDIGPYEAEYPPGALADRPPIATGPESEKTGPRAEFVRIPGGKPMVIRALDFSGQGGGNVEPIDPGTCAEVDFVRGWDAEGHWLEYAVDAPAEGRYAIRVRYTTASDAPRQITVNGRPAEGLDSVVFKATGGWKNYREMELPAGVTLHKGKNTLRLTSLGGRGCNLDRIVLTDPNDAQIRISAGAFSNQGGGEVEVVPSPLSGLFSMWNDKDHWLEWTVQGAAAGKYELVVRYATKAVATRSLSVNGQAAKGLESFELERTDDWRRCAEVSLPVPIVLKEGRNVLRMTSLGGGGLNLDQMQLIPVE